MLILALTPQNDFFASLYELGNLAYMSQFSDCLYKTETYTEIGVWMILTSFLIPLLYYQILKIQAWNRFYHWFFFLLINIAVNVLISNNIVTNTLYATACLGGDSTVSLAPFLMINAMWALIFFFVFSFIRKAKIGKASPAINVPF